MSDRMPRSTVVKADAQSKTNLYMGLAFALVFAVMAFFDGRSLLGAVIVAAVGCAFYFSKNAFFTGPCPNCGTAIAELPEGAPVRCPGCFLYAARRAEKLQELDPQAGLQGIFLIPLPPAGTLKSPPLCWHCGKSTDLMRAVTGTVDFSENPAIKSTRSYSLKLGDCGQHADAPVIRYAAEAGGSWEGLKRVGAIPAGATTSAHAALVVRDYRFHAEFLRANGYLPH